MKPVIWTGDLNVAPTELGMFLHLVVNHLDVSLTSHADLTNAKKNWNKSAGYTEVETTAFKNILELPDDPDANKFVDVWRSMHPEDQQYTYFSYRFDCRVKGIGWRLDMCMFRLVNLNLTNLIFSSYSCSEWTVIWPCQDGKTLQTWLEMNYRWFIGIFSVKFEAKFMVPRTIVLWCWKLRNPCDSNIYFLGCLGWNTDFLVM